jgi:hypothetical protein
MATPVKPTASPKPVADDELKHKTPNKALVERQQEWLHTIYPHEMICYLRTAQFVIDWRPLRLYYQVQRKRMESTHLYLVPPQCVLWQSFGWQFSGKSNLFEIVPASDLGFV